jgi:hypothetical protein
MTGWVFGSRTFTWKCCNLTVVLIAGPHDHVMKAGLQRGCPGENPLVGWMIMPAGFSGRSKRSGSFSASVAVTV